MLATARQALLSAGITDPARNVVAYRSAWNVRILLSPTPWSAERIAALRRWCDARSFDVSYYPGMDFTAARAGIYNDLPAVSFDDGAVTSGEGSEDSIADEAGAVLRGEATPSADAFSLAPATLDRPALLRRAAARPSRHHPAPAGDPAAGGDRPAGEPGRAGAGRR